jgi:glycosyltransferase involved in cell wall biosynthesis
MTTQTSQRPVVSVVIPAFRAERHLAACLDGLDSQVDPPPFEILVVDDASPDATAEVALGRDVRLVRHVRNRGAAAARNTGGAASTGDVLLFIDSDVIPGPDLVAGTAALFADAGVVAATGRYAAQPANEGRFARYKARWTWHCWQNTGAKDGWSTHLQGALAAVRRDAFEAVGGFDEQYAGGNVEDYELSARLRTRGIAIHFDDRLSGRHHFPGFRTVARNYWERTRMWVRLAPEQRGFSSGQANARSGVAALAALAGLASHAGSIVFPPLLVPALACDAVWLASTGGFLRYVGKEEGLRFAVYSAGVHYSLSAVIGAAAVSAPLGKGSRG